MESAKTTPPNYYINKVDYSSLFKRKRMVNWSHHETVTLISLWKEHLYDLRSSKRNGHVYLSIGKKLIEHGIDRSVNEIRTKVMNLTAEYRREKAKTLREGCTSNWKYYYHVNDVIGHIPVPDNFRPNESIPLSHYSTPSNDSDKTQSPITVKRSLSCDDLQITSSSQDNFAVSVDNDNSFETETSRLINNSNSSMHILPVKSSMSNSISVIPISEPPPLYQQSKQTNGNNKQGIYADNQTKRSNNMMQSHVSQVNSYSSVQSTNYTNQKRIVRPSSMNQLEVSIQEKQTYSNSGRILNETLQPIITISEISHNRQSSIEKNTSTSSPSLSCETSSQQAYRQFLEDSNRPVESINQYTLQDNNQIPPMKKHKRNSERTCTKYLREMLIEQKRCNRIAEQAENQALQLMKEQISLQKQSLTVQCRMMNLLECLMMQSNSSTGGRDEHFTLSNSM
ncbi:ELMO domain-containing protein F-like [Centruroides vittatus]|uniref:uncharacterized protein LOC111641959 n=1 Tax=Centruroides sculpturatus TaxID=218467 RepID=UPI000C6DCB76|nr:uncharacterized protein LOC111641959 [Centruroides sculpturatus]